MVMSDFRYDVGLDQSLFSLESPAGYSTQAMDMTMPREEDLLGIAPYCGARQRPFPGNWDEQGGYGAAMAGA